jgi:DNA-3-methyladenine glycosylase II
MDHPAHVEAVAYLSRVDPVLAEVIARVNRATPAPSADGTHLGAIARSIVFQQLSGRAAGTIHGRFLELFGGRAPTASELLAVPDERLRAVGLSRAKTTYLKDLARRAASGELPVDRLHELEDDALLDALTAVKGIGRWTAHMFLIFRLGRPNVLPDLDLGVQKAIQHAYRLRRLPTPREVSIRGATWSPYASFAAWYLWRSLELPEAAASRRRPSRKSQTRPGKARAGKDRRAQRASPSTKGTRTKRRKNESAKATRASRSQRAPQRGARG